ncbi:hypothetical protein K488DRAFT_52891 [Vararia minispora EC-137]|uniref:Uncharacterized protein n=1 Tax=Vararia minispora EC-137 TaxID=1314806 RepID=A0ACB8QHC9_9AGAM|nr:hypothetical protein K488DRAFT_52891 [Vararia minispora EC-137]
MPFLDLPIDILAIIIDDLDIPEWIALLKTCRVLHAAVERYGWRSRLMRSPRDTRSTFKALSEWCAFEQVKYHVMTDKAWARRRLAAFALCHPWKGRLQPVLAINNSMLVVAAGHILYSYIFARRAAEGDAPPVRAECTYLLGSTHGDVTALVFVPDGGGERTVFAGYTDGLLERIELPRPTCDEKQVSLIDLGPPIRTKYYHHFGDLIEALSYERDGLLSFTSSGSSALFQPSTSTITSTLTLANARGWSAYNAGPYAAFGTASDDPLVVYDITPSGLSTSPLATLSPLPNDSRGPLRLAVYGISRAPSCAPWGASSQTLLSGWYDGFVHLHDLRTPLFHPTLSFYDPWQYEPVYAVGGAGPHVAAGAARHSVVAFWDARAPRGAGWSVHAPGNDPSPVYALALEDGRLFGATQSRAFALDFGPGVRMSTYPHVDVVGGFKDPWAKNGVGHRVTKYGHETGLL